MVNPICTPQSPAHVGNTLPGDIYNMLESHGRVD